MSHRDELHDVAGSQNEFSGYFDVLVSLESENRPQNEDRIRGITR